MVVKFMYFGLVATMLIGVIAIVYSYYKLWKYKNAGDCDYKIAHIMIFDTGVDIFETAMIALAILLLYFAKPSPALGEVITLFLITTVLVRTAKDRLLERITFNTIIKCPQKAEKVSGKSNKISTYIVAFVTIFFLVYTFYVLLHDVL